MSANYKMMNNPEAKLNHSIVDIFTGETVAAYECAIWANIECLGYNAREGFDRYAVVSRYL